MPQTVINGDLYDEFLVSTSALNPTTTRVVASTSSVLLITAANDREGIAINNRSTATLFLSFTNPATDANSFLAMAPNSFLLFDRQLIIASAIYGIWSAANGAAHVTTFS
jgi:hypothetical protein